MAVRGSHGAGPRALAAYARPASSFTRWSMRCAPGEGSRCVCVLWLFCRFRFGGGLGALGFGVVWDRGSDRGDGDDGCGFLEVLIHVAWL